MPGKPLRRTGWQDALKPHTQLSCDLGLHPRETSASATKRHRRERSRGFIPNNPKRPALGERIHKTAAYAHHRHRYTTTRRDLLRVNFGKSRSQAVVTEVGQRPPLGSMWMGPGPTGVQEAGTAPALSWRAYTWTRTHKHSRFTTRSLPLWLDLNRNTFLLLASA